MDWQASTEKGGDIGHCVSQHLWIGLVQTSCCFICFLGSGVNRRAWPITALNQELNAFCHQHSGIQLGLIHFKDLLSASLLLCWWMFFLTGEGYARIARLLMSKGTAASALMERGEKWHLISAYQLHSRSSFGLCQQTIIYVGSTIQSGGPLRPDQSAAKGASDMLINNCIIGGWIGFSAEVLLLVSVCILNRKWVLLSIHCLVFSD